MNLELSASRNYTRAFISKGISEGITNPEYIAERWPAAARDILKAADPYVVGGQPSSEASAFFGEVTEQSVIGKMSELRRVPFNARFISMADGATGYWVSEAMPTPLSKLSLAGTSLPVRTVRALVVATAESVKSPGLLIEDRLRIDLQRALSFVLDQSFLDPSNGGGADRPASITHGITPITSSSPAADVAALIEAFTGDLSTAYFVMSPKVAASLALKSSTVFQDLGCRGGLVVGIPTLTSRASPVGQITLIDASSTAVALDVGTLESSTQATLTATGPDDPNPEVLSSWQSNLVCYAASTRANWSIARLGAVALVTGAAY